MKRVERIQLICPSCGKIFYRRPLEVERAKRTPVCSRSCRIVWIAWDCEICGKHVRKKRNEVGMMHKRRFCSVECANEGMKGEGNPAWFGGYKSHNHPLWRENRKKALDRDEHRCTQCGRTKDDIGKEPDTHHVKKQYQCTSDEEFHSVENMVSLCHKCHMQVEKQIHNRLKNRQKGGA